MNNSPLVEVKIDGDTMDKFLLRCKQYAEGSKKTAFKLAAHVGQSLEVDAKTAMRNLTQPYKGFRYRIAQTIGHDLMKVKASPQSIEAAKTLLHTSSERKQKKEVRKRRVRVEWTPQKSPYIILRYSEMTEEGVKRHYNRRNKSGSRRVEWKPKKGQRDWSNVRYLAKALTVRRRMFSTGFLGGQLADGTKDGTQIKSLKNIASSKTVVTKPETIMWNNYNISKRAPRTLISRKGIEFVNAETSKYVMYTHPAFLKDGERTFGVLRDAVVMSTQNLENSPYIKRILASDPTKPETL